MEGFLDKGFLIFIGMLLQSSIMLGVVVGACGLNFTKTKLSKEHCKFAGRMLYVKRQYESFLGDLLDFGCKNVHDQFEPMPSLEVLTGKGYSQLTPDFIKWFNHYEETKDRLKEWHLRPELADFEVSDNAYRMLLIDIGMSGLFDEAGRL